LLDDLGTQLQELVLEKKRLDGSVDGCVIVAELNTALDCVKKVAQSIPAKNLALPTSLLDLGTILEAKYSYKPSNEPLHCRTNVYLDVWSALHHQDDLKNVQAGRGAARMLCKSSIVPKQRMLS
jgi:hypothetical protein